jgi:hypothetical protein
MRRRTTHVRATDLGGKVVLFANTDWYLYNFRRSLALALQEAGHELLLISPPGPYGEILAHGFARARCPDCTAEFLVAFSCKGRGVCPSCTTKRLAATAAHLVDSVIPRVPMRPSGCGPRCAAMRRWRHAYYARKLRYLK